jgi:exodeoxyribonuclease-3
MLRIVTLNLNGIRSACRKGFLDWIHAQQADVVCVQEVKAHDTDLDDTMRALGEAAGHFHFAQQKGYSGVGLYGRRRPKAVRIGFGCEEFDREGRYVEADFGKYTVISLYVPSGASSPERQAAKFRFLGRFERHLLELKASGREIVLCGDVNIAHKEIDLRNWRSNQKNSGFLPEEREWLTGVFDDLGWVDTYRKLFPDATDACYTWWSNRGEAWAKNVGWRLDYQLATPELAAQARGSTVYKAQRFSDHAPLTVDYDCAL